MLKRLLSLMLMTAMVLSLVPFAVGAQSVANGGRMPTLEDIIWVNVTHQDVEIFVTDGYNPIENAEVTFDGETKITEFDGKVSFADIPAREDAYSIEVTATGFGEKTTKTYVGSKIPEGTEPKIDFTVSYWTPGTQPQQGINSASIRTMAVTSNNTGIGTPGEWVQGASMNVGRYLHSAIEHNNRIYVIGGLSSYSSFFNTLEIYDIATDTWVYGNSMSVSRAAFNTILYDDKIYVFAGEGGYAYGGNFLNSMEIYDINTGEWKSGPSMINTRHSAAATLSNGKVYIVGGYNLNEHRLNSLEIYDIGTETWSRGEDLDVTLNDLTAHEYEGKIYVVGGASGRDYYTSTQDKVRIYNPITDTWSFGADMLRPRCYHSSILHNGKIYAIGGTSDYQPEYINSLDIYDIDEDTWTQGADMMFNRASSELVLHGDKIYTAGGYDIGYGRGSNTFEIYDIDNDAWTQGSGMMNSKGAHTMTFYNNKLYVIGGYNGYTGQNTLEIYTIPEESVSASPLTGINPIADIEVTAPTTWEAVLALLPTTVTATFEDGSTAQVPVNWADAEQYFDPTAYNVLQILTASLPAGINNPENVQVTVGVTVITDNPPFTPKVVAGDTHIVALGDDGRLYVDGLIGTNATLSTAYKNEILGWYVADAADPVVDIYAYGATTVGLTKEGKVKLAGLSWTATHKSTAANWPKIKSIAVGSSIVAGVDYDGNVHVVNLAAGAAMATAIDSWYSMNCIAIGSSHAVGLDTVGGWRLYGDGSFDPKTSNATWNYIKIVDAGANYTAGIDTNSNLFISGVYDNGEKISPTSSVFSDIRQIYCSLDRVIALTNDDMVLWFDVHQNPADITDEFELMIYEILNEWLAPLSDWRNMEYVTAGKDFVVGFEKNTGVVHAILGDDPKITKSTVEGWDLITN